MRDEQLLLPVCRPRRAGVQQLRLQPSHTEEEEEQCPDNSPPQDSGLRPVLLQLEDNQQQQPARRMACTEAACDSDGSISWEDFIGTTTDLVPQLLGMFDEIARGKGTGLHLQQHGQLVSASLQKRLSIAQRRRSRASTLLDMAPAPGDEEAELTPDCCAGLAPSVLVDDSSSPRLDNRDLQASPTALRYSGRRCQGEHNQHHHHHHHQPGSRPLSGSSIGSSSTSSSGCSNQGTAGAANPYLASVESLADTCASSQGSGDSGVVTVSESSGGGGGGGGGGVGGGQGGVGRANGKIRLSDVDRATAARYFDERRPRYCDPHRSPVERVLLEIVDTEADYVEHLRQVIQGYLIYWRNDPISLLRDSEINGLFSNIEDIYEFNRNFLSALDNRELDPITVANTFTEHNDGFKVYTEYCTNYPRTVSILTKLMGQEDIAREFRERQAALGHDLPLGSFLLKPVQRILKYHLLLENLSREFGTHDATDGGDGAAEARAAIVGALDGMTGIARHINEMKRKHEHAVRVQEIQSLLYGWPGPDLTTSGELIAEGSFRMRGAKAPRHAFLFDRMLLLTKRKEDGLLVYKAHILCSNLTLMESIPGEPLSFHVIPFDNSQLQYKLQARNLEQKREWTLQIKRVILENYNAVIPSHARQLVLQIGQNKSEDDFTPDRGYKKSTEYFDRKADRRRSETSLRQKLRKGRKSDVSISTAENSPMCPRKNQSAESIHFGSRDENLNRSSEIRGSKIKDRFTSWRRKSEPGFQSYINLHASDREDEEMAAGTEALNGSATPTQELVGKGSETQTESEEINESVRTKENCSENGVEKEAELDTQERSVEEIVGNILKQSQEFQRRLEKHQQHQLQRNPSYLHKNIVKKQLQQRLNKPSLPIDSSEDEESEMEEKLGRTRTNFSRREQCFMRAVNAYHQRSFRSQYDSFRNVDVDESVLLHCQRQVVVSQTGRASTRGHASERRSPPEGLKRPNIVTESKVIKTALRIRENCDSTSEHDEREEPIYETPTITKKSDEDTEDKDSKEGSLSNYDNLQHTWESCLEAEDNSAPDCPTKTAVWLTKLCEGLPDQPQKCGSLPRSFQMMNPVEPGQVSKSRFLQRDGKSMTERPFTIASDKPAEINLEDMERYASSCQGSARIAKFPIAASGANGNGGSSASSSTFFCSLDDASFTDADALARPASLAAHVHPDHKIYRANGTANKEMSNGTSSSLSSSSLRNVLSRAGSRLQGLRSSQSTEALECSSEEPERGSRYFRSFSKRNKQKPSPSGGKSTTSDVEETTGCGAPKPRCFEHLPYHKQGSPSLGARIAQADYADPTVLFSESRRNLAAREAEAESLRRNKEDAEEEDEDVDDDETAADDSVEGAVEAQEGDSFYERSFETIENYADGEAEEAFRDSAIFSDVDDSSLKSSEVAAAGFGQKVPPTIPSKTKIKQKPAVTQKPAHLKLRARIVKCRGPKVVPTNVGATTKTVTGKDKLNGSSETKEDDVSAGQSQVGWVKRMVGQLQAQVDA